VEMSPVDSNIIRICESVTIQTRSRACKDNITVQCVSRRSSVLCLETLTKFSDYQALVLLDGFKGR